MLPRGNGRRSLPTEGGWLRSTGDGGQGPRPKADRGAAALSKSLLGTHHSSRQQMGTSKGFSNNGRGNLPLGSLHTSLSSGSISITRTSSPTSPATRDGLEPITLTVRKQWSIFYYGINYLLIYNEGEQSRQGWHNGSVGVEQGIKF